MSFMKGTGAERSMLWLLIAPSGRIRRTTFALAYGLLVCIILACAFMIDEHPTPGRTRVTDETAFIWFGLLLIASAFGATMIAWKRLQDIGLPGFFVVAGYALLPVFPFAPLLLWGCLAFIPGNAGPNKFGPPPVWRGDRAAASPVRKKRIRREERHDDGVSGEGAGLGDGPGNDGSPD